ncbi:MAG: hypothetical protein V5A39_03420 [Haloarculaceae archaeon]
MVDDSSDQLFDGIDRRQFLASIGGMGAGLGAAMAGGVDEVVTDVAAQEGAPEPGERITSARRIGTRDVTEDSYKMLWSYRKRQAAETLVSDPAVNDVIGGWIASFEAYDPLTNNLDAISVQGTTGMNVEAEHASSGSFDVASVSASEATAEPATFTITVTDRQVAYGLVDRVEDELVGLHITDPMDIEFERGYTNENQRQRHAFTLSQDEVWQHLEGRQWYPFVKVAEIITGYADYPHGAVTPIAYYFNNDDGGLSLLSCFVDVSGTEFDLLDVTRIDEFTRKSPMEIAAELNPSGDSQVGDLPVPPMTQRPQITGPEGFHNIDTPPETIDESGWEVNWSPPTTEGAVVDARYNGSKVFEDMAAVATPTGYDLPERNGRNTREWYFPDDKPVFSGNLLYWDIHSSSFGGPGVLGKTEYPETDRHPGGFRLRTHFHTGALPNAVDFHSGHRFGPYNYYINFDFYEDGIFMPSWQRQGPGYITEYLNNPDRRNHDGPVQYYLSYWSFKPTPGVAGSVQTEIFDGDEWYKPEEEVYVEGDEQKIVRFTRDGFSQTIDIPLDNTKEMVIVRADSDEIGEATRVLDPGAELAFYHPAQYADGQLIQGREVIAWLILEGPIHEVPHPSGITTLSTMGEFHLSGYD